MKVSVNKALAMATHLKERRAQLKELEGQSATRSYWADRSETKEPVYDVAKVDKLLVDIDKALFEIDSAIKESNAKTKLELPVDYDALMTVIEK